MHPFFMYACPWLCIFPMDPVFSEYGHVLAEMFEMHFFKNFKLLRSNIQSGNKHHDYMLVLIKDEDGGQRNNQTSCQ